MRRGGSDKEPTPGMVGPAALRAQWVSKPPLLLNLKFIPGAPSVPKTGSLFLTSIHTPSKTGQADYKRDKVNKNCIFSGRLPAKALGCSKLEQVDRLQTG